MGNYQRPSSSTRITSSFDDHNDRNPPSTQPGTDYGVNYGSTCCSPSDGKVTATRTNAGPTTDGQGRYVSILFDDGREARVLHLSRVDVGAGDRVERGQRIGLTGASGFGSDYYYGAHVHQTLWPGRAFAADEIDFEQHVGNPPAPTEQEDDDMPMRGAYYTDHDGDTVYMLFNEGSGWYSLHQTTNAALNNAIASAWGTGPFVLLTEGHAQAIQRNLDAVREGGPS